MRVCVSCKTRYQKGSGVTFHKFPTGFIQKRWLINMNIINWIPNRNDHLCSNHFKENCFIRHVSRTILKKDSVPTIYYDVTLPEERRQAEAELINYDCQEDQVDDMKLEELAMSDPSTSCNRAWNESPKLYRTVTEMCENIKHDHRYENTPRSSKKLLQRVQNALRNSQTRVKTLSQQVKRLKISVSFLKTVIKE